MDETTQNVESQAETTNDSPTTSLAEIFSKEAPAAPVTAQEAPAEEVQKDEKKDSDNQTNAADETNTEVVDPKDVELAATKKRLEDTQKWGNTQRQATLKLIKGLQDKGLSEEEVADAIGGKEAYDKVLKGIPVEDLLASEDTIIGKVFNDQVGLTESVLLEQGETVEALQESLAAYNALAYNDPKHKAEVLRRATNGENVPAYIFKVGKSLLEDFNLQKTVSEKGLKAFLSEKETEIRSRVEKELKEAGKQADEQVASKGKPNLAGGSSHVEKTVVKKTEDDAKSLTDIFGR